MTPEQARALVEQTVRDVVPDAVFDGLADDADLRRYFELDSLDFVQMIERLSGQAGFRIEEDDYDQLRSMTGAVGFLVARSATVST